MSSRSSTSILSLLRPVFECLEDARKENSIGYVKLQPQFAPYRDDPRFQAILEGMGLAD